MRWLRAHDVFSTARNALTTYRTPWGLCARSVVYNCVHAAIIWYLSGPADILWRCLSSYRVAKPTQFRLYRMCVYQNAEERRLLCACSKCTSSRVAYLAIPLRQTKMSLCCCSAVGTPRRFVIFMNATRSPWGRSPGGVTGVLDVVFQYVFVF